MPISWDTPLVFLSVLIAIIGASVTHAWRMRAASGRAAGLWMVEGSIALGATIRVCTFGMLAFHLPILPAIAAVALWGALPMMHRGSRIKPSP